MRYLVLLCALASTSVVAGPFGLEKGMSAEDLKKTGALKQVRPNMYEATSVANGHPDFSRYVLVVTPEHGLCKIMASTDPIATSVYGTELVEKFDRLETALKQKYGEDERLDLLRPGSIWNEPKDWMIGLLKKERDLVAGWQAKAHPLPDNLKSIALYAKAATTETGFLALAYEFDNVTACLASLSKQDNSSL